MSINRYDVAKEKIFIEGKKWKPEDLSPLVCKCIGENKVGFVELFIEKGFYLGKIITVDFLENLYTADIFNGYKSARILYQILRLIKFKKINKKVSLYDIGRVLKHLLGDLYYPLYLRDEFQPNLNSKMPFERPIRELYIWSLLTLRMELAQILWTLEKESIAAALFASNLLRSMKDLTDVISDREDLIHWAGKFEEKAEGVVEECYKENPDNTRENLIRELDFYGYATYLELAADGNSIKFIAHRSCQELLDFVWRYSLDETTKSIEFITYLIIGLFCPFILPSIVHFKPLFYLPETEIAKFKSKGKEYQKNAVAISCTTIDNNAENESLDPQEKQLTKFRFKIYWKKIIDFYSTPVIKFSYTIFFYLLFILYFTFLNLTGLHVKNLYNNQIWIYLLLVIWTLSLAIEEVRQAFDSGISFKAYISDIWNKIDIMSHFFFFLGTFGIVMTLCDPIARSCMLSILDIRPMSAVSQNLLRYAKFAYGFSIFLFTVRILQYFSINVNMGPIIVMIQSMLANDLGPFMAILMVFLVSYGILLWSINFEVKANMSMFEIPKILYQMFRTSYFQLFGDLRIDILRGENLLAECSASNLMCPDVWGVWIGPIIAAVYLVLSSVLMLNLLIAIFSNTYEIIQSSATQYWTLERYHLMRQSSSRPPVAPPLIIFWQIYYFFSKIFSINIKNKNPFKTSYVALPMKEKQLVQWEHMRAIDYMRSFDEVIMKKRSNTTLVVNRGSAASGSLGNVKKDLEFLKNEINDTFKERIQLVENRFQRLDVIEENVETILEILRNMKIGDTSMIQSKTLSTSYSNRKPSRRFTKANFSEGLFKSSVQKESLLTTKENIDIPKPVPEVISGVSNKDNLGNGAKLWGKNVQNHFILRLTPLLNDQPLKMEFVNDKEMTTDEEFYTKNLIKEEYGVPVNPHKTLNKIGKYLLPFWGSNSCIHMLISRWKRDDKDNIVKHLGKPVLQIIGIAQNKNIEIPFLLVQHNSNCLLESCSTDLLKGIIKEYINMISQDISEKFIPTREKEMNALSTAIINEIYRGYIDDYRNTDNSWMDTVAFNIQQIYNLEFSNKFLRVLEHHESEKACWVDVIKKNWKNPSNISLLSLLTSYHEAAF